MGATGPLPTESRARHRPSASYLHTANREACPLTQGCRHMIRMIARRAISSLVFTTAAVAAATFSFGVGASAAPAEGVVQGAGGPGALPDRYIVVMKDGSTTTSDALAGKVGGTVGN